jgi:hypothetical protein
MVQFIFNTRNERLTKNPRQSIGSNKNYAINRHASWQHTHNKNTSTSLGASARLGASPCNNCSTIDWYYISCVPNKDNSCQWKCTGKQASNGPTTTIYCNGNSPDGGIN